MDTTTPAMSFPDLYCFFRAVSKGLFSTRISKLYLLLEAQGLMDEEARCSAQVNTLVSYRRAGTNVLLCSCVPGRTRATRSPFIPVPLPQEQTNQVNVTFRSHAGQPSPSISQYHICEEKVTRDTNPDGNLSGVMADGPDPRVISYTRTARRSHRDWRKDHS